MSEPRFSIGIDLGTTHCALSYVDLAACDGEQVTQQVLPIPQLTAPGSVESLGLLPSFIYLPHASELADGDLSLPWTAEQDYAVGEMARSRGAATPDPPGVERQELALPRRRRPARGDPAQRRAAGSRPAVAARSLAALSRPPARRLGPGATGSALRRAGDRRHHPRFLRPGGARTDRRSGAAAGCERMLLLEEPQAALYSWIQKSAGAWRKQVRPGDIILVVDVGGGTSDFSLIAVLERDGNLELHRVAVGEHILLGGDNMDLALAYAVAGKLAAQGSKLDAWQLRALTHACRAAKEALLSDPDLAAVPLVVASRGAKLIGGSMRSELTREELAATLLEGFFPPAAIADRPQGRGRAGLTQLGLPYAQDAAVTRHLAAFLARQVAATADLEGFSGALPADATFLHPTAVLFNGGVFKSELLAERLLTTVNSWLAAEAAPAARLLEGADLDLAVARGAAYYGYVRRGQGVRIRGGTAQAYYVAVESVMPAVPGMQPPVQALCLAPFGMEEGSEAALSALEFGLVVGEQVRFRFFGSSVRRQDEVGTLLEDWDPDELQELDEIQTTLPSDGRAAGEVVRVSLHARVTEAGTTRTRLSACRTMGAKPAALESGVRRAAGTATRFPWVFRSRSMPMALATTSGRRAG
jgi:hypothetical protein